MPHLIVAILTEAQLCHDVIHLWEETGVTGATIVESIGMRGLMEAHANRDDLPLFPSLRKMLESEEIHHRTIFSVVPDGFDIEGLIRKTETLVGDFDEVSNGFLFVVPVTLARGLQRRPPAKPARSAR
jgi:hypothetical protein